MNTKAIINGKIFIDNNFIVNKVLLFNNKIINILNLDEFNILNKDNIEIIDANNNYVLPGFIDQHIHGYKGYDIMDKDENSLLAIKKALTPNGVTSFLPTTVTASDEDLSYTLLNVRKHMGFDFNNGAKILGVHLEGPYINCIKKGAQNDKFITEPDFSFIEKFKDVLKIITVAPETKDAMQLINTFKDKINFQIGHSNATYEQAINSINNGIVGGTHTFNAMSPLHHRDMGVTGAILTSNCYAELICDNVHVTPTLYNFVIKNKGVEKILLITDCMSAGGLEEGEYSLGGLKVILKNNACRLTDGTLAGSTLKLNIALKNIVENSNYELCECIKMITSNQAKYLGIEDKVGTIKKGLYSDLVIMNENYDIEKTFVNGVIQYEI